MQQQISSGIGSIHRSISLIFKEPILNDANKTAFSYLQSKLWGPILKSYWPARFNDFTKYGRDKFSIDVPLSNPEEIIKLLKNSRRELPISLNAVYRASMSQWRRNRERGTIGKSSTHISATNLGKLATGAKVNIAKKSK